MKTSHIPAGLACAVALATAAFAHERSFTYSYEPLNPPKGETEFEQHITWRAGRNSTVGQDSYNKLEFREELEYGVTDWYQASLYFNHDYLYFKDPATGQRTSHYRQTGFSLENKFMVVNPVDHAVGVGLYLEPTYDGENFELEQKIILGQRYQDWRWALNITHATEWENDFREKEGELEVSLGITRKVADHWWIGIEARDHNEIPEYKEWENTAVYVGPVVTYKRSSWFVTVSVMPQVFGSNFTGDPDNNHHLELEGHEQLNVRVIFGFDF